jgi:catechol 2,3-dioxygenase-like lactoylglutathione lyase family enzyme
LEQSYKKKGAAAPVSTAALHHLRTRLPAEGVQVLRGSRIRSTHLGEHPSAGRSQEWEFFAGFFSFRGGFTVEPADASEYYLRLKGGDMLNSAKLMAFVPIQDVQKSRPFYEGVLGLRFVSDDGFALVMESNGTTIRLAKAGKFTPAGFTILGWQVAAIETAVSDLEKKGVRFEKFSGLPQDEHGIWTAPGGDKVAWFKDPDGNILSVSQHV